MSPTDPSRDEDGARFPELDTISVANDTKKAFERLASFCGMRSSAEPSPQLDKALAKINGLIQLIETSMLSIQDAYQLASITATMYDPEQKDSSPLVSFTTLEGLAKQGLGRATEVADGFREVEQSVYKIAASTKDDMLLVIVPSSSSHMDTPKIHLKDIGNDLVSNLKLFSLFSQHANDVLDWWRCISEELGSTQSSLFPRTTGTSGDRKSILIPLRGERSDHHEQGTPSFVFEWWCKTKDKFQGYYNVIHELHIQYEPILPKSSAAWKANSPTLPEIPSRTREDGAVDRLTGESRKGFLASILGRVKKPREKEQGSRRPKEETKQNTMSEKDGKLGREHKWSFWGCMGHGFKE